MSRVAIIGNGNVGYHFASKASKRHEVIIFSRSGQNDEIRSFSEFDPDDFDFTLLTLPDDSIKSISNSIDPTNSIILHTSGSRPLSDLSKHEKRGVVYPFQTFSREKEIDFNAFPIFIEGTEDTEKDIFSFMRSFSTDVRLMNSASRAKLHLAAVFACNFTNHMYYIAEAILSSMEMPLKDLKHLASETLEKATDLSPAKAQTGPAARNDIETMSEHLEMIDSEEWKKIYELISVDIRKSQG